MFYIYHIPGVKIGCSTQPQRRVKRQGYSEYTIIETHDDIDIASNREIELQVQYGYKKESRSYKQFVSEHTHEHQVNNGRQGGIVNATNGTITKAAIAANIIERTCPHCGKTGKGNRFKSYHLDNGKCKLTNK